MSDLRDQALLLLARREHSQHELRQKLLRKAGVDVQEVEQLLVQLACEGLQSDQRFAEAYIRFRAQVGFGPLHIGVELQRRGINSNEFEQLMPDMSFWEQKLFAVWQKKFHNHIPISQKEYAKQLRFLLQRGFASDMVHRLLREAKEDLPLE